VIAKSFFHNWQNFKNLNPPNQRGELYVIAFKAPLWKGEI
jgi:hypothetical protein